jgi:hypothetical protein
MRNKLSKKEIAELEAWRKLSPKTKNIPGRKIPKNAS